MMMTKITVCTHTSTQVDTHAQVHTHRYTPKDCAPCTPHTCTDVPPTGIHTPGTYTGTHTGTHIHTVRTSSSCGSIHGTLTPLQAGLCSLPPPAGPLRLRERKLTRS